VKRSAQGIGRTKVLAPERRVVDFTTQKTWRILKELPWTMRIRSGGVAVFATEGRCAAVSLVSEADHERAMDSPNTVINFDAVGVQAST